MSYIQDSKKWALGISAISLGLATGVRFESWFLALIFFVLLAVHGIRGFVGKGSVRSAIAVLALGAVPCVFPVVWLLGNYVYSGDPLFSLHWTVAYKTKYTEHIGYVNMLMDIAPITIPLEVLGIVFLVVKREWARLWPYLLFVLGPLLMLIVVFPGGQGTPANPTRYMVIYPSLLTPYAAYLLVEPHTRARRWWPSLERLGLLFAVAIVVVNARQALHYPNGTYRDALAAGRALRHIGAGTSTADSPKTLLEVVYWDYLAVQVGSNDSPNIVLDRPVEIAGNRDSPSILLDEIVDVTRYLQEQDIAYAVVKSGELRMVLEQRLGAARLITVGQYIIYSLNPPPQGRAPWPPRVAPERP